MGKNIFKIATFSLLLLFASCIRSEYDVENCPSWITVTPLIPVEMDSGYQTVLDNPTTTMVSPMGEEVPKVIGPDNILQLTKGYYQFYSIKDDNDCVSLDKSLLSVALLPSGGLCEPSSFVGGSVGFVVENSEVDNVIINHNLQTYVQSRQLVLRVKLEGANLSLVQSLSATVSGITQSRDLLDAFIEGGPEERYPAYESGYVEYLLDDIDGEGYRSAGRRVIGLDKAVPQLLKLKIDYSDSNSKLFQFDITDGSGLPSIVSNGLSGFMTNDILLPFVVKITVQLGADFSAEIIDWIAGPELWLDAKPTP